LPSTGNSGLSDALLPTRGSKVMILKGAEWLPSDVVRFTIGWKDARSAIFDTTSQRPVTLHSSSHVSDLCYLKWKTVPRQCLIGRPSADYQLLLLLSMQGEEAWDTGASQLAEGRSWVGRRRCSSLAASKFPIYSSKFPHSHGQIPQFSSVYISNQFPTQIFSPNQTL
jgi:hypothetical protein